MKETGLMFKAPLVRAILSGQKTQTRRVMKLNFNDRFSYMKTNLRAAYNEIIEFREQEGTWFGFHDWNELCSSTCPFGKPGDRIYVRETWCQQADDDGFLIDNAYWYRATNPDVMDSEDMEKSPWRPSIHMPKTAARIWLEVTGVRVERLQSISRADAIAEGIKFFNDDHECAAKNYMDKTDMDYSLCPTDSFETLWKSTGGDWDANPWVWVIDFKTISTTGRPA